MSEIKKSFFSSSDVEKKPSELCIFTITIMTTRQTGGLLWGYKPLLLNSRLKALILLRKILVLYMDCKPK